jgi:hypothetical protein
MRPFVSFASYLKVVLCAHAIPDIIHRNLNIFLPPHFMSISRSSFPSFSCAAWAYKYDPNIAAGIQTHADEAAVNLNVWITPTEACVPPPH